MGGWPYRIDLTQHIRPGDTVSWGHAGAEPQSLISQFFEQRHAYGGNVGVFLSGVSFSDRFQPEYADVLRFRGIGGLTAPRSLARAGKLEVLPCRYSDLPSLLSRNELRIDVVFVSTSLPDGNGLVSLGTTVAVTREMMASARVVIAEINPNTPYVGGDTLVSLDLFDACIQCDSPLIEGPAPEAEASPQTQAICAHIARLIGDRATVQIGIGSIGTTLPRLLQERRDLGIHSAIITDGLMELVESGAANGRFKEVDVGIAVAGELIGSTRLYRYAHCNRSIELRRSSYVLSPDVFAKIERLVSVNSAIEVDLSGQVNAETLNGVHVGAVGGQVDFVRGASHGRNGISIIALPSVAKNGVSRIVPRLTDSVVTTARSEVHYVITEYGAANLRGLTVSERARALATIAHPDHREALHAARIEA